MRACVVCVCVCMCVHTRVYVCVRVYRIFNNDSLSRNKGVEEVKIKKKVIYYFARIAIVIMLVIKTSEQMSVGKVVGRTR